jgi:hypothetical protein
MVRIVDECTTTNTITKLFTKLTCSIFSSNSGSCGVRNGDSCVALPPSMGGFMSDPSSNASPTKEGRFSAGYTSRSSLSSSASKNPTSNVLASSSSIGTSVLLLSLLMLLIGRKLLLPNISSVNFPPICCSSCACCSYTVSQPDSGNGFNSRWRFFQEEESGYTDNRKSTTTTCE